MIKNALAGMLQDQIANRPSLLPNRLVALQTGPERRARASPNGVYRNPKDDADYDWETPPR
jgi:hypothetical protein